MLRLSAKTFLYLCFLTFGHAVLAAPPPPTEKELEQLKLLQQPNSYFEERLQNPQETVDGQPLHPKIQYYIEQRSRSAAGAAMREKMTKMLDTAEGREWIRTSVDRTWNYRTKVTADMASVEDRKIPGPAGDIEIRIYRPAIEAQGPLPVLLYFHGGAWLFSSIEAVDRAVRLIANEAEVMVVSANYRLSPEHKFPAAQDDALATYQWLLANAEALGADPDQTAIGGDSAGAGMSFVTAMRQRDAGLPVPQYLLLYYPALDMSMDYRSYDLFGEGYGLDIHLAKVVFDKAFPDEASRFHPYASPIRVKDVSGMPATIIATAGYDMLRDQGAAMAKRLDDAGVSVVYLNYGSLTHGFMQHSGTIDDAEAACIETARLLGQALRGKARMQAIAKTVPLLTGE